MEMHGDQEIAAKNIRTLLVKAVSPVLKSMTNPSANIAEYKALYGSLGPYLQAGVFNCRQQVPVSEALDNPTVDDQVTPRIAKKRAKPAGQAAEVHFVGTKFRREVGDPPKDIFAAPTQAVSKLCLCAYHRAGLIHL